MELSLKDLIYVAVYIATVTGFVMKIRERLNKLETAIQKIEMIVFLERGGLNVVTQDECLRRRTDIVIHVQDIMDQIKCSNRNIVKIMLKLNLEPEVVEDKITPAP